MSLRLLRSDLLSRFNAIELRHADVEYGDLRVMFGDQFDGLPAIAGLGDDLEVGLLLQQKAQTRPDDGVVVCKKNPYLHVVAG